MAGIAADVFEQDLDAFLDEAEAFGVDGPDLPAVDVAVHGPQGGDGGQGLSDGQATDVPGVPDLVGLAGVF